MVDKKALKLVDPMVARKENWRVAWMVRQRVASKAAR
jgi:hypothetical protein